MLQLGVKRKKPWLFISSVGIFHLFCVKIFSRLNLEFPGNQITSQSSFLSTGLSVWQLCGQGLHIQKLKHKRFLSCMSRRMGENPKTQSGNERPFKLCYSWDQSEFFCGCGAWCWFDQMHWEAEWSRRESCTPLQEVCHCHTELCRTPLSQYSQGRLGISGFQSWKEVFSLPFSGLLPSWRKPSFSFGLMLSCLEEVPVCLLLPCYVWPWHWYCVGSMAYSIKQVLHLARLPATR